MAVKAKGKANGVQRRVISSAKSTVIFRHVVHPRECFRLQTFASVILAAVQSHVTRCENKY